jgi:hypothetical protein
MSQPSYAPQQVPGAPLPPQPAPAAKGSGFAVTALVLGIVGLVFSFIPLVNIVGIILGIIGLIFGLIGIFKSRRTMSIIGSVLSLLAIILSIVISGAFASSVSDAINDAAAQAADSSAPSADGSTDSDPLSDGGFTASDIQVEDSSFGTSITARVTNTDTSSRSGLFTLTIFDADKNRIGQATGSVNELEAGQTATVTFVGTTDQLPGDPGTYSYELQTDGSY